ncbi:MAG TPA: phosphate signaling complex protein PhoU [Longimicrobiales bacterium]|nr:phosphate signaling complex protein PhoU [Longimicrobiales bacterium]
MMSDPQRPQRHFHDELDRLQERLMTMAHKAEAMVEMAVTAVENKDRSIARIVRERDEEVDDLEVEIDEQVTGLLALHQPMASDLRQVISALKVANDLERVGDHAVNVARAAKRLSKAPPLPEIVEVGEMAVIARRMLADALNCYVARDPELAVHVCETDDKVDALRHSLYRILLTHMLEDPSKISGALELLRISQSIERIADLATNVAEDVVYMVEGQSMKHGRVGTPPDYDLDRESETDGD